MQTSSLIRVYLGSPSFVFHVKTAQNWPFFRTKQKTAQNRPDLYNNINFALA